mmetsp:Transcript_129139/g.287816  ORF Transcript_129139/g.287816 Transcript_129139/m.287816 type:complete len:808 (-) Transcript_129139:201-2624(-)
MSEGQQTAEQQVAEATDQNAADQESWECSVCTLMNESTLSSCDACGHQNEIADSKNAQPDASDNSDETKLKALIGNITNATALKTLESLVGNVVDSPHEPKFRGPIRKANAKIRAAVVEVVGSAEVLKLAGFQEEAEFFMIGDVDQLRLSRTRALLQEQLETISASAKSQKPSAPSPTSSSSGSLAPKPRVTSDRPGRSVTFARRKWETAAPVDNQVASPAPPVDTAQPTVLRLRMRLPESGSSEFHVAVDTTVATFQSLLLERTGIPVVRQRLRFGYPPRVLVADRDVRLLNAGIGDSEVVILEDLHELFLGNLESGRYTMDELIRRLPPDPPDSNKDVESTEALFRKTLVTFGINLSDRDFWGPVRQKVEQLVAGEARSSSQRSEIKEGLLLLQRLFQKHDPQERLSLIVNCLPIPASARQATRLNRAAPRGATELAVDRADFFGSVLSQILNLSQQQLLAPVVVRYKGEKGLDWGGLTRDFFSSFATRLGEDESLLWKLTARGSLHPTADVVSATAKYESGWLGWSYYGVDALYRACGRVFGMAVLHGCKLGCPLSRPFVRVLVGAPPQTLEELQHELNNESREGEADFRGNPELLDKPLSELGLEGVLTFTRVVDGHGEIPLIPGGTHVVVDDENKAVWLNLTLKHELVTSIEAAASGFRSGLIDVFGGSGDACPLLCLLDAHDLIELWGRGGVTREQVALWRSVASVSCVVQRQAHWFFEVLEEDYDDELRGKVLQFTTGASSIGREGLRTFIIEPADGGDYRLPSAMTCGNMIQLPRYSCRAVLALQLRTAAEMCGSFAML